MRYKLVIEYDGTNFSGWQKQKNAVTIQGTIIEAVESVLSVNDKNGKFTDLQGSGRTDAGVHAYGQAAHLECDTKLEPEDLKQKINDLLPASINILSLEKADERFHARHWAKSRQYVYRISKGRSVFERRYCWPVKEKLDVEKMQELAKIMIGMHDFISFSDKPNKEKSTKVVMENIKITETDNFIFIKVKASHFLWKMVRRIVGVLVEAGKGKISEREIKNYLDKPSPEIAVHTAPASGLFLEKVYY